MPSRYFKIYYSRRLWLFIAIITFTVTSYAILYPFLSEHQKIRKCTNNLRVLEVALDLYAVYPDNFDRYPQSLHNLFEFFDADRSHRHILSQSLVKKRVEFDRHYILPRICPSTDHAPYSKGYISPRRVNIKGSFAIRCLGNHQTLPYGFPMLVKVQNYRYLARHPAEIPNLCFLVFWRGAHSLDLDFRDSALSIAGSSPGMNWERIKHIYRNCYWELCLTDLQYIDYKRPVSSTSYRFVEAIERRPFLSVIFSENGHISSVTGLNVIKNAKVLLSVGDSESIVRSVGQMSTTFTDRRQLFFPMREGGRR
jgi:hypothetical protein